MRVLIIIPAYNEQDNIKSVINKLQRYVPSMDYLIINDCSKDETVKVCDSNNFNYISLPINLGIGGGVQTGYKYAWKYGYDIAVQHDGDGQHDPAYIVKSIEPLVDGTADIVIGSRFIEKEGFQSSRTRRIGIKILSWLIYICGGVRIKDVTSGFRAVNREYIKFYAENYPTDYPEPEAIISATLNGAKIQEIPVIMRERKKGTSSINFGRSLYYMIKVSCAIVICRITKRRRK